MNYFKSLTILLFVLTSCNPNKKEATKFTIAFGSCNNQVLENKLWEAIELNNPSVWIWGGDIIYSDTEDMLFMEQNYLNLKNNFEYANFSKNVDVLATWDDHDYGLNDGGTEYLYKEKAQQLFLDFLDIPENDERRLQKGIYHSKDYKIGDHSIKVLILDTRYFRTALTIDSLSNKRYKPNKLGEGTMLGETQWNWLEKELKNSNASFNIIVSSIQFLSNEHGFESWGNMPHEIEKLEAMLKNTKAKNTILLSGDRHISEISKKNIDGLSYSLIDFTSSGMTHSYTSYKNEPNRFRVVDVVSEKSFGVLHFDFELEIVKMEIRGGNNVLFKTFTQKYNL
ncbi:MAG: alkaline phosphatase family protein [Bacteroidetes bacterium]|nr:alkaline phosphatase family protein [Bacteroidota bacterium]